MFKGVTTYKYYDIDKFGGESRFRLKIVALKVSNVEVLLLWYYYNTSKESLNNFIISDRDIQIFEFDDGQIILFESLSIFIVRQDCLSALV